jgi:hypothetical protein
MMNPRPKSVRARPGWGAGFCAALVAFLATCGARAADETKSPHWDKAQCGACHAGQAKAQPIAGDKVDAVCLKCHDGRTAWAEVHPVGRRPPKEFSTPPRDWPLWDGRVGCVTCHDVKQACAFDQPSLVNTTMIRSFTGPAGEDRSLCDACHTASQNPKFNPHLMMTADRKPIRERCLACHTEVLDATIKQRTGKPMLRGDDQLQLCRSCHPHHKEQFSPGHIGSPIKPEMLAFMRAREAVGLTAPPGKELVEQLKAQNAKPTLLLPASDGTIVCSTCHNPHQAGLFTPGTSMAYRPMRLIDSKIVSPVRGENWCNHCHNLN